MAKFEYDYYSGAESEQFRFLKTPKVFFEDPDYEELGLAECVLYGFLHEQVALSKQNGWVDEDGRTYVIRSLESIQKLLRNCSPDKARSTLKNLIDFGLIEKKRRGQGKPDIIYVKNFVTKKSEISSSKKTDACGKLISENGKTNLLIEEKASSRDMKKQALEVGKSAPNNTLLNIHNFSETNHNLIKVTGNTTEAHEAVNKSSCDSDEDEVEKLIDQIKANIDYYDYAPRYQAEHNNRYEEMFQVIVEMVVGKREKLVIGGTEYPQCIIKKRFLSLNSGHVEYAMWKVAENLGEIRNIKKYMIATLFNAPTTMDNFYTQLVHHDMHSEEWYKMIENKKSEDEVRFDLQDEEAEAKQAGIEMMIDEEMTRRIVNE